MNFTIGDRVREIGGSIGTVVDIAEWEELPIGVEFDDEPNCVFWAREDELINETQRWAMIMNEARAMGLTPDEVRRILDELKEEEKR